ncbi:MAG: hypothetical protein WA197_10950 [Candidatus Acidiferrales bacterium]
MKQSRNSGQKSFVRRSITGALLAAAILATSVSLLIVQTPSQAGTTPGNSAPTPFHHKKDADTKSQSGFVADKGKFRIMVNGQPVGKEEFEIGPSGSDWIAHGSAEIQSPQGNTHVTGTLTIHPDGTPSRYEWATQGTKKASAVIGFNGMSATVELQLQGARPFTQQFTFTSPLVVVLDNNLYHQYELLAHLYDWQKKGAQSFSVLVPQELTPGTVTVDSMGEQELSGKKVQELRVRTEDNELDLYLDGPKLMRVVAPAANAEIIREEPHEAK